MTLSQTALPLPGQPVLLALLIAAWPAPGWAIPSPELVIGSVSSLSQLLALGLAAASGFGAMVLRRLGIAHGRHPNGSTLRWGGGVLALLVLLLTGLNLWQYQQQKHDELTRMQATLLRPAQFDGTRILDPNLHETSYSNQLQNPLTISTDAAARLLRDAPHTRLVDIRETGEFEMGSLPGARHIRFPDFLTSDQARSGAPLLLFCHNGNRSSETCAALAARGIDCRFIAGGIEKWISEGRPFGDGAPRGLSELRALPDYPNKSQLVSSAAFSQLMQEDELQVLDTRYPGDYASGHLPGAINLPIRALPSDELHRRIAALDKRPTVTACYDRRSCFMAQVLGLELSRAGIPYLGRYTTPWDYFVAPPPKPHVQAWLEAQQASYWQRAASWLGNELAQLATASHLLFALLLMALAMRLLVLPVALKAERDQMITARHQEELRQLKQRLKHDSLRRARALRQFQNSHGITPMRNLLALLFLPLMMLGLSASSDAAARLQAPLLWLENSAAPDPTYLLPLGFALLAGSYLHWALARSQRQAVLYWSLGGPILMLLVVELPAAAVLYLCLAIGLLLLQRGYVQHRFDRERGLAAGSLRRSWRALRHRLAWRPRSNAPDLEPDGIYALADPALPMQGGNKAWRLGLLLRQGFPVPPGLLLTTPVLAAYATMPADRKQAFGQTLWHQIGQRPCAVRSSAQGEDGADHSYAGVYDSVLHANASTLTAALDQVLASFTTARAACYGQADDAPEVSAQGNILVQQMVAAEYAGVLFTEAPDAPGQTLIELVAGDADALVSGRVRPQTLRFGRYSQRAMDDAEPPIDLAPLLGLARRIEALFGTPQDIEWAYADGHFQILQSRDITTRTGLPPAEQQRLAEWRRLFQRFDSSTPEAVVLEMDEMAELLPAPTPLSLSLMAAVWAPGGSLDLACRALMVPYDLPEGRDAHLVTLFGQTYADTGLKERMALSLSVRQARRLRNMADSAPERFRNDTLPAFHRDLSLWQAVDFDKLPLQQVLTSIDRLQQMLLQGIYVEVETINILAGFAMQEASQLAEQSKNARQRLMQPQLQHSPAALIAASAALPLSQQRPTLLAQMGHRAPFDYELSTPRYHEAPEALWPLLQGNAPRADRAKADPLPADPVTRALDLQDLKEQAKHEAMHLFATLRRALLTLGKQSGLDDLIFYLRLEELPGLASGETAFLTARAKQRQQQAQLLRPHALRARQLTLHDCERLSQPVPVAASKSPGTIVGTRVAGLGRCSGRVYVADMLNLNAEATLDGFRPGDILVCRMISPAWLPQVQSAAAVLSEMGGWLSHMAIVARESGVTMLVGCSGLDQLQTGDHVTVSAEGLVQHRPQPRNAAGTTPRVAPETEAATRRDVAPEAGSDTAKRRCNSSIAGPS